MFQNQRMRMGLVGLVGALLALPLISLPLQGQASGRMRVLVANLNPREDADDNFGQDLADELRDLIDLPTHVALSDDDIDDAAREYDMRLDDLNCLLSQQLAAEIDAGMVLCGTYTQAGESVEYTAQFITVPGQESFPIDPQTVGEDDIDMAASHIMQFFNATIEKVSQIAFCGMEFNSSNWDAALEDCGRAVELAPESNEARLALATTLRELERWEESLDQFEVVLENDPFNIAALENAGYVASQIGETDAARDYYSRYLELNPSNVAIRIRIANDLAESGDDLGGMQLLEEGLEQDPENVGLHEQYGSMAARAALTLQAEMPPLEPGQARTISPEVADLFRRAVRSLTQVLDARGEESLPQYVQSIMAAHIQLGEMDEAIALGQRGTQYFPRNAQVRSVLANALNQAGQLDQAIATLEEALELDSELENAYARMGQWLLNAERVAEAGVAFTTAAERGEQPADNLASLILNYGYNIKDQQEGDLQSAMAAYEVGKEMPISSLLRSQFEFFHGYALFRIAEAAQLPNTPESAQASLPVFRETLSRLNAAREYGDSNPGANLDAFIANTNTFIEIQEAIIARANR